eukprot:UN06540
MIVFVVRMEMDVPKNYVLHKEHQNVMNVLFRIKLMMKMVSVYQKYIVFVIMIVMQTVDLNVRRIQFVEDQKTQIHYARMLQKFVLIERVLAVHLIQIVIQQMDLNVLVSILMEVEFVVDMNRRHTICQVLGEEKLFVK